MSDRKDTPDRWSRYRPSAAAPWDARRVVHLFRRTGFGATWWQVQAAARAGCDATLEMLLSGGVDESGEDTHRTSEWFQQMSLALTDSAIQTQHAGRLKAAWIFRMLNSPDPLAEQLTLMWHNHFATSNLKVSGVRAMWQQNELFRADSRKPFAVLLRRVLNDPAMLIWLDADSNTKRSPNENLARELLELFTLGIGNYSENDVKESARALTGRTVREGRSLDDPHKHDDEAKTVLGQSGKFTPDELVELLVARPATARRLAWRICQHFMGDGVATATQVDSLAAGMRARQLDINWAVTTVLTSEVFFSNSVMGRRVSPPAVFVNAAVRALGPLLRRPSPGVLADWMAELGQDLFYPPNVGGWPAGRAWLSSQRMIARIRFAEALAEGRLSAPSDPRPVDLTRWQATFAPTEQRDHDGTTAQAINNLATLLLGRTRPPDLKSTMLAGETPGGTNHQLLSTLLSLPEAQID